MSRCVIVHRESGRRCKGLVRDVPALCRKHARSAITRAVLADRLTRAERVVLSQATWSTRADAPPGMFK